MNVGIDFINPIYWVFAGGLLIFLLSYWVYFAHQKSLIPKGWRFILFFVRFAVFFMVLFLLLKPVLKLTKNKIEKPVIPVFIDNSQSVGFLAQKDNLSKEFGRFINELQTSNNIKFDFYRFGGTVLNYQALDFKNRETNFSKIFHFVENNYSGQNLSGIVILSDGNYNRGLNPVYLSEQSSVPCFAIGLGDSSITKDIRLDDIIYNKISYKNALTEIKVRIGATKFKAAKSVLEIKNNGILIYSKAIRIGTNSFFEEKTINLELKKTGLNILDFYVKELPNERNVKNNYRKIAINVVDKKTRWLILGSAPHPDIAAIHHSLATNLNFDVESGIIGKYKMKVKPDVLVLHQLPDASAAWERFFRENNLSKIPKLIIVGKNTNVALLNSYSWGEHISLVSKQLDLSNAHIKTAQSRLVISPELATIIREEVPINTLYAKYKIDADALVLFTRIYKNIETNEPLLIYVPQKKNVILNATGLWRWSVNDYKDNGTHANFDDFSNRIASLLLNEKKSESHLEYKNIVERGEKIIFDFFNQDSLALKQLPKIKINNQIISFNRVNNENYRALLSLDTLGSVDFLFEAVYSNGKKFRKQASFYIVPNTIEYRHSQANFGVLHQMAQHSNGAYLHWNQRNNLLDSISAKANLKSVITPYTQIDDFIHYKWFFFLILVLLTAEWLIRKYLNLD